MSLTYTNQVKTVLIDPTFNRTKTRSEFRFEKDALFMSNMRLLNVGSTQPNEVYNRYHYLTGALSNVKSITLYDGRTIIDQCVDFQNWMAFKVYNNTNSSNSNINKKIYKHGLGFVYHRENDPSLPGLITDPLPVPDPPLVEQLQIKEYNENACNVPTNNEDTTPTSWFPLSEVLPFLKTEFVNTSIFKNLILVLDYVVSDCLVNGGAIVNTVIPLLVVDQVMTTKPMTDLSKFSYTWNAIEKDTVYINQGQANFKYQIQGFNSKFLGRLLIQKMGMNTDLNSVYLSNKSSVACLDETYQFIINGSSLIPDSKGLHGYNQKLDMLTQTWGNCNCIVGSNTPAFYKADDHIKDAEQYLGRFDYVGILIGSRISDSLQIEYSRKIEASFDDLYTQKMAFNVFGEVQRTLTVNSNGTYQITYN
jgi:hypothetical protein